MLKELLSRLVTGGSGKFDQEHGEEKLHKWAVAKVTTTDGEKIVHRIRLGRPQNFHEYSTLVVIDWPYQSASEGLPTQSDSAEMSRFEDLVSDLYGTENTIAMFSANGGGSKEWGYYTRSQEAFVGELNQLLMNEERFPIEISYQKDHKWNFWKELIRRYTRPAA